jgi:F0F1-type ATP synthase membrane subunit b/b'
MMSLNRNASLLLIIAVSASRSALAEAGEGIPWDSLVIPQIVNFIIFAGALFFLLRKPVVAHFAKRKTNFESAVIEAGEAMAKAKSAYEEIKNKIDTIETTSKAELLRAQTEAANQAKQLIAEANVQAKKHADDVQSSATQEVYRSVIALKQEFLKYSFDEAEATVKVKADDASDMALRKDFMDKAKAARI